MNLLLVLTAVLACYEANARQCIKGDIVFALDESTSVKIENFKLALKFTSDIVEQFSVSSDSVRVGMLTFATSERKLFDLSKYTDSQSIQDAIKQIDYKGGVTNTPAALRMGKNMLIDYPGARNQPVPKILVLMTDGRTTSYFSPQLQQAINGLRQYDIKVFALGIGKSINKAELIQIAGNSGSVRTVDNFRQLADEVVSFTDTICEPARTLPRRSCDTEDIVLALDISNSVGRSNFNKAREFVSDVVGTFTISSSAVRVGMLTFGKDVRNIFDLSKYSDVGSLQYGINRVQYKYGGNTNIPGALRLAKDMLTVLPGARRPPVPKVLVLMTDGNTFPHTIIPELGPAIEGLRANDITVFAVGIGKNFNKTELNRIAGNQGRVKTVDNFDQLSRSVSNIAKDICTPIKLPQATTPSVAPTRITPPPPPTSRQCKTGDIVFGLDESGSVKLHNFILAKDFTASIVGRLRISYNEVRVGLLAFSDRARVVFDLLRYVDVQSLQDAIRNVSYTTGQTNTPQALNLAKNMLTQFPGARSPPVPKLFVLMTDGKTEPESRIASLPSAIEGLRQNSIKVLVLGIGSNINKTELSLIAGKSGLVRTVENFQKLADVIVSITEDLCGSSSTTPPLPPAPTTAIATTQPPTVPAKQCETGDILFALDESGSVTTDNFELEKDFTASIAGRLRISFNEVRVGLLAFAESARSVFDLSTYTDVQSVQDAIRTVTYSRGETNTPDALNLATNMLTNFPGARPSPIRKVLVLMTDGQTTSRFQNNLPSAIQRLRDNGITVLAVGITKSRNLIELNLIAGRSGRVTPVENFQMLAEVVESITQDLCPPTTLPNPLPPTTNPSPSKPPSPPPEPRCFDKVDIVIILDSSSSVGEYFFKKSVHFLQSVIKKLMVDITQAHIGLVAYSDTSRIEFGLQKYTTTQSVVNALERIRWYKGKTNTPAGLDKASEIFRSGKFGARANVPRVAIVMTDGRTNINTGHLKSAASELKRQKVTTISIGVGSRIKYNELFLMAGSKSRVFRATNHNVLARYVNRLSDQVCKVVSPSMQAALAQQWTIEMEGYDGIESHTYNEEVIQEQAFDGVKEQPLAEERIQQWDAEEEGYDGIEFQTQYEKELLNKVEVPAELEQAIEMRQDYNAEIPAQLEEMRLEQALYEEIESAENSQ